MLFIEDQDMVQALAAKRPDQAFNIWVLISARERSGVSEIEEHGTTETRVHTANFYIIAHE